MNNNKPVSWLQAFRSAICSIFGIQSKEQLANDFKSTQGHYKFIIALVSSSAILLGLIYLLTKVIIFTLK